MLSVNVTRCHCLAVCFSSQKRSLLRLFAFCWWIFTCSPSSLRKPSTFLLYWTSCQRKGATRTTKERYYALPQRSEHILKAALLISTQFVRLIYVFCPHPTGCYSIPIPGFCAQVSTSDDIIGTSSPVVFLPSSLFC